MVELALVLPVLLLLALGVIDFARALQSNNILVSLSREGANLAARTTESPQYILKTLMDTAAPLSMNSDGMMYVTKLVGRADGGVLVEAQYRPPQGGNRDVKSRLYSCNSWTEAGVCNMPTTRPVIELSVGLREGETVYAVESFYAYELLTHYVMADVPLLYSITIL
jgi:hypothetical protein